MPAASARSTLSNVLHESRHRWLVVARGCVWRQKSHCFIVIILSVALCSPLSLIAGHKVTFCRCQFHVHGCYSWQVSLAHAQCTHTGSSMNARWQLMMSSHFTFSVIQFLSLKRKFEGHHCLICTVVASTDITVDTFSYC